MSGRFEKGRSGNPGGRPKARRPNVSAFDIIFDKTLTATQNGVERELTIDEALELQTYQAALKGSKMAQRQILKMIAAREVALAKQAGPVSRKPCERKWEGDPRNADEAMLLLGITIRDPDWVEEGKYGIRMKLATWAAQAALGRPGRRALQSKDVENIRRTTFNSGALKWPRSQVRD